MKFDSFELDPEAYVLKKSGHAVKLERIPMELLLLLAASHGRLLTREEIVAHIWGKDRFIDSESAINTAIRKLRNALSEDPEHPKYIETVPRRGYRFIADVADPSTRNGSSSTSTVTVATQNAEVATAPRLAPSLRERNGYEAIAPTHSPSRRPTWIWLLSLTGVTVLLLIALAVWISRPRLPVVTNAVRITNDGRGKNPWFPPVTDGVHLYFVEGLPRTTGSRIAQLSASGGETTWINTAIPDPWAIYDISPGGSGLLVANGVSRIDDLNELWIQPLPAGAPHRVGNILASAACWTPDGTHIVYANGTAITIANRDGSEPRELVKFLDSILSIRVSPDGRRIRFSVRHVLASASSIWEMNADGTGLHQLLSDWKDSANECCGNWSPDGRFYYFQAGGGNAQAVWVLSDRHSFLGKSAAAPTILTSGLLRFSSPVPSNDGKKLFVLGEAPRVELFRYDQKSQRFDSYLPGLSAGPIDFSPDRKWIAYVMYPDGTLWRSRVDGSEKMQLTFPPVRAYEPRWSPDGSRIAFMDIGFNHPWKISLISSSGGNPQTLVPAGPDQAEADPTWTPDGKSIVFAKAGVDKWNPAIYSLDLKSGQVSLIPGSDGFFSPRVSPDGRYISAIPQHATGLVLFDTTTNHRSTLAAGQLGFNEWSNDGKYIYMRCLTGNGDDLVRVRVKDRVLEHVLSLKDFPQSPDIFASWFGLTPDDAPLLMRDRSIQEIYALDLRFP